MKNNRLSRFAVFAVIVILIVIRLIYLNQAVHTFQWDSLGYYLYLPAKFIYHDIEYLRWFPSISEQYHFPGNFYQASLQPNGKYVLFYSIGISLLQMPFFFIGHWVAGITGYAQDGFSAPYQLSVCFGMLLYAIIGLIALRKVLLHYFPDPVTAWVLLLTTLATNYPQYTAVEAGFTHGYLFTLYCLLLLITIEWHNSPSAIKAATIGFIVGLATVVRPTEAVMIFVPLLWKTQTRELRREKFSFIRNHKAHLFSALIGGLIPLIPQLIYWKEVTGGWIHKMGSKWDFLNPHWRVLIGWEKGWFIYTPIVAAMVIGLFFIKRKEYGRSIVTYFLLNLWIIIAWHEWRYGGSYSTRALTQSLAVMAIPLAAFLEKISVERYRIVAVFISVYFCFVNLFQIWQYNKTIIHYDDMNRYYYGAVYLNPHPTPLDMSLLDTDERLCNENNFEPVNTIRNDGIYQLHGNADSLSCVMDQNLSSLLDKKSNNPLWLKISTQVKSEWGAYGANIIAELHRGNSVVKKRSIRLQNAICDVAKWNRIEFYFQIPAVAADDSLRICFQSNSPQHIEAKNFQLNILEEKPW